MGNPGRRRRPGRRHWLRALISRDTPERSEAAAFRLIADPAEFGWPEDIAAQRPLTDAADGWLPDPDAEPPSTDPADDWPADPAAEPPSTDPADGWPADPAAYQWLGDWTDQPAPGLPDGPAEPDWAADSPAAAVPAATAQFAGYGADQPPPSLGRRRRTARPGRLNRITQQNWYLALARYRWYVAVSAGAGAMALASGVILLLPHQSPRAMMADARSVPGAARTRSATATPSHPVASPSPDVSAHATAPAPAASTPTPAQAATVPVVSTPATSAPGFVAVTYRLVQHWSGGIIGKYTIANESNAVLSGWQFTATFPGDQVQFVIGAADPDLGSDVLVLEPSSAGAQIAPGGRVSVIFFAAGQTASPVHCSFNGTTC